MDHLVQDGSALIDRRQATYPPSIVMLAPVTKPDSGPTRYATMAAISAVLPMRPSGISGVTLSAKPDVMSVTVGPGWTLLTVMPRGARSIATPRTSEAMAPLVIE